MSHPDRCGLCVHYGKEDCFDFGRCNLKDKEVSHNVLPCGDYERRKPKTYPKAKYVIRKKNKL